MTAIPWWVSPDPWAMSPDEVEAADERHRAYEADKAATPDEPPY